jgi:hypothetical protein
MFDLWKTQEKGLELPLQEALLSRREKIQMEASRL